MHTGRAILYALTALASSISYQTFNTYAQFFYTDVQKLPYDLVRWGIVIWSIWNAANDPLAGSLSDRTRSRWGRRIPYIAGGALPLAATFFLVWAPPFDGSQPVALFIYFLFVISFFDAMFTIVFLNTSALFPEMFPTLDQRARVGAIRQVFQIVGLLAGVALPPLLYGRLGWTAMGGVFAAVALVALLLSLGGMRENPAFSRVQAPPFWPALRLTLRNRAFALYVTASAIVQLAFVFLTAGMPFYAKYVLGVSGDATAAILAAVFVVAMPLAFVWSPVTRRLGARATFLIAAGLFAVALAPFGFVTTLTGALLTAAALGVGVSGILLLLDVLLADVIDEDELHTGARREGMYFGAQAIFIRLAAALQALVFGWVLAWSGYDPNLAVQPATAATGFRLLMTVAPMAAALVVLAAMWRYPLHGRRLEQVKARLAERRAGMAAGD